MADGTENRDREQGKEQKPQAQISFFVRNEAAHKAMKRRKVIDRNNEEHEAVTVSWNWRDTWQNEHKRAFVVAKMAKADMLTEVHDSLQKALDEGVPFEQWKKEIVPKLESKWLGKSVGQLWDELSEEEKAKRTPPSEKEREKVIGSERLELIFRTNMAVANAAGHYEQLMKTKAIYPYWRYVTRDDARVRDAHRALHNKVFKWDDPFWETYFPPNGFRCRCHVSPLTKRQVERDPKLHVEQSNIAEDADGRKVLDVGGSYYKNNPGWDYNPGDGVNHLVSLAKSNEKGRPAQVQADLEADLDKKEAEEAAAVKAKAEAEEKRKAEEVRQAAEAEKQRKAAEAAARAEAELKAQEVEKRLQEAQSKVAQRKAEREAKEAAAKAEAERLKAEKKVKEEDRRQAEEAEKAEKARQEAERKVQEVERRLQEAQAKAEQRKAEHEAKKAAANAKAERKAKENTAKAEAERLKVEKAEKAEHQPQETKDKSKQIDTSSGRVPFIYDDIPLNAKMMAKPKDPASGKRNSKQSLTEHLIFIYDKLINDEKNQPISDTQAREMIPPLDITAKEYQAICSYVGVGGLRLYERIQKYCHNSDNFLNNATFEERKLIPECVNCLDKVIKQSVIPMGIQLTRSGGLDELRNYIHKDAFSSVVTSLMKKLPNGIEEDKVSNFIGNCTPSERNDYLASIVKDIHTGLRMTPARNHFVSTSINMDYIHGNPVVRTNMITSNNVRGIYIPAYIPSGSRDVDKQNELLLGRGHNFFLVSAEYDKSHSCILLNVLVLGTSK